MSENTNSQPETPARPTILVTGATGFIGQHIVQTLLKRGYSVRAMRRAGRDLPGIAASKVEWVDGDLDAPETLRAAMRGCPGVIHCAGFYPRDGLDMQAARQKGVGQIRNLFDECLAQRVARVVYISSPATLGVGDVSKLTREDKTGMLRPDPERQAPERRGLNETDFYVPGTVQNAYFEAKWAMEAEVYRYMLRGLAAVVLVPSAVFGPGDHKPTSGEIILRIARGKMPALIGDTFNMVDVRDVADSAVTAMERGRPGRRYILGGSNLSVADFGEAVSHLAGVDAPRFHLPAAPVRGVARAAEKIGRRIGANPPAWVVGTDLMALCRPLLDERARAEIDHTARPYRQTLTDSIAWFRENNYL